MFASFLRHAEAKSLDSDGRAGVGEGWLERRPVREGSRAYTGKESNQIEEVTAGFWGRLEDVQAEYGQSFDSWFQWVVPVLKEMPLSLLMRETGLDRRTLQRLRNRHAEPRRTTEKVLTHVAGKWARLNLRESLASTPRDDALACRAWIEAAEDNG